MFRDSLILDGEWTLYTDPGNTGMRDGWYAKPGKGEALTVSVPAVWDLWIPEYDGVAWYYRTFPADTAWKGKRVVLHFDAVNYGAEVWVNGEKAGEHEGGYTPFSFDITALIRPGKEQQIAVRVIDPKNPQGWGPFLPKELPISKELRYWSFAGIWGQVRIDILPTAHIADVFIRPDLNRSRMVIETTLSPETTGDVRLSIEGAPCSITGPAGLQTLEFPGFTPWTLENPHLYFLHAELLQDGKVVDEKVVRFGMREFTVKDNRFYLNGRPIFLKGVLHQPDYARTLAAPESVELARREIELAKEAGFNMIRLHIKPASPMTLDLADELGILLYEEPAIGWIKASPHMRARCEREVREMVLRDRNRPSVVIWGMLNETGNADYATNGGAQTIKEALCQLTRSLDPTRVIIDDSAGMNATREPSRYMRPYTNALVEFDDLHVYQRAPVDLDIENYFRHNGEANQLCTISEFGFGAPEDLPAVIAEYGEHPERYKDARALQNILDSSMEGFKARELERVFGDFSGFAKAAQALQCDAAKLQIDAMRSNAKISGYCYTQLADAGREFCAGIADRWRRKKPVADILAEIQQPLRPIIQIPETNLASRQEAPVTVLLANEEKLEGQGEISLQLVGPTGQVLWKKKRGISRIPKHGKELWEGSIAASGACGPHKFVVRLLQQNRIIASGESDLFVVEAAKKSETPIHLLDPHGEWAERFRPLAQQSNLLAPVHIIPPLANTIRAYPDNELMQILAQVRGGAVAIFFGPPDDWNDMAEWLGADLTATPKDAVGAFMPVLHYVKTHPVFDGLPVRVLMRQPYRNVVPSKAFLEMGEEDICGCYDANPALAGDAAEENAPWWGSDILVRRLGAGRIVFTHLRILEHLGMDPVADRIFVNLLAHFGRRSVPADAPLTVEQRGVEWLRAERNNQVHRWMVIGEFPNWDRCGGFLHAFPPEKEIDFDATYPGWYKPVRWKRWYSLAKDQHRIDLQTAFSPVFEYYPKFDRSVGYAYTEFNAERRQEIRITLGVQDATKVWLNGTLIFETEEQTPHDEFDQETIPAWTKQGRNTVLVKIAKTPGPFRFAFDFESFQRTPLMVKWWK